MLNFITDQYWEWVSFFPMLFSEAQSAGGSEVGSSKEFDRTTSLTAQVVVRKPLRRTIQYDRSRKHL
ncbi:hypothetical protein [Paraburkholderia ginsengisoli]|uniref:Uncharacterized protein n=1 Tax=Paraburkholderia ginsengisoli TaxID=311231 RepID=A0A7T4N664_9BURK|nr:hypothetical protein [Paraburkholderia ginsengisoli]QQC65966.1 hypothetical protein I6I06_24585 [Paraburkholderia ginsengisoli]